MPRISSFTRGLKCPQSIRTDTGEIRVEDGGDDYARFGSACHEALAQLIIDPDKRIDFDAIARNWNLPPSETKELVTATYFGLRVWTNDLAGYFPNPKTEIRVTSPTLSKISGEPVVGHIDLGSIVTSEEGAILDWKMGYNDIDYWPNMRGYALAFMEQHGLKWCSATIAYLRQGYYSTQRWSLAELTAWAERDFAPVFTSERDIYRPGPVCRYCPRQLACPGRKEIVQTTLVALTTNGDIGPLGNFAAQLNDPEQRKHLGDTVKGILDRMTIVTQVIEAARAELKRNVEAMGPIPLPAGKQLAILTVNRRHVNARKAWPILEQVLSPDEIWNLMELSAADALELVGTKAPRGQKGKLKESTELALKEAGALTLQPTTQLRQGRATAADGDEGSAG